MTTTLQYEGKTSRRGMIRYTKNPFVSQVQTNEGTKRITNSTGTKCKITSENGDFIAPVAFHEIVTIDRTQFIKLYINGIKALKELTAAGTKVFELLCIAVQDKPGQDQVLMHYASIDQNITKMSRTTFARGMNELIEKEFIAEANIPATYFLNINYMFNGNRMSFIKEFRCKPTIRTPHTYDHHTIDFIDEQIKIEDELTEDK